MKKYMTFGWVIEGGGWFVDNTLEDAKKQWCFGRIVFEIDAEYEEELNDYGREVKSNRLMLQKIKEKFPIVYQEGEPPDYLVSK